MYDALSLWFERSLWVSFNDLSLCSILLSLSVLSFDILIASIACVWALADVVSTWQGQWLLHF